MFYFTCNESRIWKFPKKKFFFVTKKKSLFFFFLDGPVYIDIDIYIYTLLCNIYIEGDT